ncbi:MAG: hypothetical protein Q8O31_08825, partial [Rhodocyclaceae bacterium]|nr:hypothetical protein [Rhodocyclaceae bacterium]
TLPLKGRERCSSPLKGRERCSSPFKGEAGRGMGNVFHVNECWDLSLAYDLLPQMNGTGVQGLPVGRKKAS